MDHDLDRVMHVLRSYDVLPHRFSAHQWPPTDPAAVAAQTARLSRLSTQALDGFALDVAFQIRRHSEPNSEYYLGLRDRTELMVDAVALDQEMTRRGYTGPSQDYLNGVAASTPVMPSEAVVVVPRIVRGRPDEFVRGFGDGLRWLSSQWRGVEPSAFAPAVQAVREELERRSTSTPEARTAEASAAEAVTRRSPAALAGLDFPGTPAVMRDAQLEQDEPDRRTRPTVTTTRARSSGA